MNMEASYNVNSMHALIMPSFLYVPKLGKTITEVLVYL